MDTDVPQEREPLKRYPTSLSEPQIVWLEKEASRLGISAPELMRRILDEHRHKWESDRIEMNLKLKELGR